MNGFKGIRSRSRKTPPRSSCSSGNRRATALIVVSAFAVSAAFAQSDRLPVPQLLELRDRGGALTGSLVAHEADDGLAYNGSSPGPTVVLDRGTSYELLVDNTLDEATTVHWHGLNIAADADGGPRQPIAPDATWTAKFTIDQPAGTAWYHPHAMGTTARQVALGLAGMIIVRDRTTPEARAAEARLPSRYGVDDLPVIVQDRRLDAAGASTYRPTRPDIMHGFAGNTLLTNGAVEPVASVPRGWVRLRVLNGGNASYLALRFPDEIRAHVIATEGGYLPEPVATTGLVMAAAERYEILVNTDELEPGETVWIAGRTDAGLSGRVLGLQLNGEDGVRELPDRLPAPAMIVAAGDDADELRRRRFVLEAFGMMSRTPFTINGRAMDMQRIDERIELGTTEIWEVTNAGPMPITHSFHLHGTHFQVLSVDGSPPPPLLRGLADTVIVPPGTTLELAVRFENSRGVFMYHCHMLEHEEAGMMGQVEVY